MTQLSVMLGTRSALDDVFTRLGKELHIAERPMRGGPKLEGKTWSVRLRASPMSYSPANIVSLTYERAKLTLAFYESLVTGPEKGRLCISAPFRSFEGLRRNLGDAGVLGQRVRGITLYDLAKSYVDRNAHLVECGVPKNSLDQSVTIELNLSASEVPGAYELVLGDVRYQLRK